MNAQGQVGVQRLDIKVDPIRAKRPSSVTLPLRGVKAREKAVSLVTIWMLEVIATDRSRWIAEIFILSLHAVDLYGESTEDRWALMWVDFGAACCHSSGWSNRMDKLMSFTVGMTQVLRWYQEEPVNDQRGKGWIG